MSHGKLEKFARMANQIGEYYATRPAAQAAEEMAGHIRKFWTPKMIAETVAALNSGQISLNETAAHGFVILSGELAPAG